MRESEEKASNAPRVRTASVKRRRLFQDVEELWRFFSQRLLAELHSLTQERRLLGKEEIHSSRASGAETTKAAPRDARSKLRAALREALEGELEHCRVSCDCCCTTANAKTAQSKARFVTGVEGFCGVLPLRLPERSRFLNSRGTLRSRVAPVTLEECLQLTLEQKCQARAASAATLTPDPSSTSASSSAEGETAATKASSLDSDEARPVVGESSGACLRCREAHSKTFVRRLPVLLFLHLARSSGPPGDSTGGGGRRPSQTRNSASFKIKAHVAFPALLQPLLAPYLSQPPQSGKRASTAAAPVEEEYKLRAVIEHQGRSGDGGHYVCYRKSEKAKGGAEEDAAAAAPEGSWWVVNDGSVRPSSWEEVRQAQAYILLYEREKPAASSAPVSPSASANGVAASSGRTLGATRVDAPLAERKTQTSEQPAPAKGRGRPRKETSETRPSPPPNSRSLKRRRLGVQTPATRSLPWGLRSRRASGD